MTALLAWSSAYRAAALKDRYGVLRAWREGEGFEAWTAWARNAVRDTIQLVLQAAAGILLDGDAAAAGDLLGRQVYDPRSPGSRLFLVFEAGGLGWARLYVDRLPRIDLDHLHQVFRFRHLTIRRVDGRNLRGREVQSLRAAVRAHLGSDGGVPATAAFDSDPDRLHVLFGPVVP